MMIFPRKKLSEKLTEGVPPGILLACTDNGWITQDKYLEWFKFFLKNIPVASYLSHWLNYRAAISNVANSMLHPGLSIEHAQ